MLLTSLALVRNIFKKEAFISSARNFNRVLGDEDFDIELFKARVRNDEVYRVIASKITENLQDEQKP